MWRVRRCKVDLLAHQVFFLRLDGAGAKAQAARPPDDKTASSLIRNNQFFFLSFFRGLIIIHLLSRHGLPRAREI